MAECPFIEGCIFYRGQMPKVTELLKSTICKGKYEACARYIVVMALGKEKVPGDLYPSDMARAKKIIEKGK